jgi:surface protein
MASAWLIVTVLAVHVASVSAVFRPTTKGELNYGIWSCLTNNASGVQCCAASPYCNAGPGTASFTDDIGDWDTSLITNMDQLFMSSGQFNADIGRWDTSQVTMMNSMFRDAFEFNQPIGSWNTSKVTNMAEMFRGASVFNQDITA